MSDDLTPADYAILLVLQVEDREISNNELDEIYGVRLKGPAYAKLNAGGYVVSNTKNRPYRHRLSRKGENALGQPLEIDEETDATEKRTIREKQLWAALVAVHKKTLGLRGGSAAPQVDDRSLDERVRAAYDQVADRPGDWVDLTAIRPLLPDVAKGELDKALEKMLDAPDVRLDPEVHRHRIGKAEKEASVRIGGEDRHKLAIGLR